MTNAYSRIDQALRDLLEAYTEIEAELEKKFSDDEESYSHALIEALETAVESALEDQDISTSGMASVLSNLTEALEQLDPAAFEGGDDDEEFLEEEEDDDDIDDADLDIDDDAGLEDDEDGDDDDEVEEEEEDDE